MATTALPYHSATGRNAVVDDAAAIRPQTSAGILPGLDGDDPLPPGRWSYSGRYDGLRADSEAPADPKG
ncbi:MAG: hypothetical protein ACLR0N_04775 [Bilophila wadsworthia]